MHRVRAAEAGFDLAGAAYRSAVLGAFQNVADALRALESDQTALAAAERAAAAAERSLAIVRRQLDAGGAGYLAVLNVEQAHAQAVAGPVPATAAGREPSPAQPGANR